MQQAGGEPAPLAAARSQPDPLKGTDRRRAGELEAQRERDAQQSSGSSQNETHTSPSASEKGLSPQAAVKEKVAGKVPTAVLVSPSAATSGNSADAAVGQSSADKQPGTVDRAGGASGAMRQAVGGSQGALERAGGEGTAAGISARLPVTAKEGAAVQAGGDGGDSKAGTAKDPTLPTSAADMALEAEQAAVKALLDKLTTKRRGNWFDKVAHALGMGKKREVAGAIWPLMVVQVEVALRTRSRDAQVSQGCHLMRGPHAKPNHQGSRCKAEALEERVCESRCPRGWCSLWGVH